MPDNTRKKNNLASGNLFRGVPPRTPEEIVETLVEAGGARFERITSHGQASPPDFWYDQDEDEWVAVVSGSARLRIEGEIEPRDLAPGDWIFLPARLRHRVESTHPHLPTVWLAIFLKDEKAND